MSKCITSSAFLCVYKLKRACQSYKNYKGVLKEQVKYTVLKVRSVILEKESFSEVILDQRKWETNKAAQSEPYNTKEGYSNYLADCPHL